MRAFVCRLCLPCCYTFPCVDAISPRPALSITPVIDNGPPTVYHHCGPGRKRARHRSVFRCLRFVPDLLGFNLWLDE